MKLVLFFLSLIIIFGILNKPIEKFKNCKKCKLHYFCLLSSYEKCFV